MKNLLYKELKLVIPFPVFLFSLLSALLLIPSYPYVVGMMYFMFGVQIVFNLQRANMDQEFTMMLPVPRNQIVLCKHITIVFLEAVQIFVAIIFGIISSFVLNPQGNMIGMDANAAFFGITLIEYGIFNILFLTQYFKTGYKVGMAFIKGISGFVLSAIILEFLIAFVPVLHNTIDGLNKEYLFVRIIILLLGIIIFSLLTWWSYKISVKKFKKVNL